MLQRLSIRGKILAVVAVPILVLLLAVGVVSVTASQSLNDAENVEQLLEVLGDAREVTADAQEERSLSVNYVNAYNDGLSKRNDAEASTDTAVAALDAAAQDNPTDEGEAALAKVDDALNRTQPTDYLVDLRAVDVVSNGIGEWPTFPSAEDAQATAGAYAAIAQEISDIENSTPASAELATQLSNVAFQVELEGTRTLTYLTEPATFQAELIALLPSSDASLNALDGSLGRIGTREDNEAVQLTVADLNEQLAQLSNVRTQVVNRSISVQVLAGYFGDTLNDLVKLPEGVAAVVGDRTLAAQLRAYAGMEKFIEAVRAEEVNTNRLLRSGFFLPGDSTQQRSFIALTDIALTNAQDVVDPLTDVDDVPPFGASGGGDATYSASYESIRTNISSGFDASLLTESNNGWNVQVQEELDTQTPIRDAVWANAQETSNSSLQSTLLQTILTIVGAVLVVIATILIALLIARRIIGPLRRLTTTATAVRQELPRMVERVAIPGESVDVSEVQIPVESNDEIGRLAEAFNGVNATTLAIAGEQAALRGSISEMFVNVARRDQVLLNRQLSSIDEMERKEDDPATLTRLFALDHLATRMRRNSESLLVLAGIDTGRRLRRPMPLSDVIRTASSEIELYERVQLELDADPAMVGHAALTVAHLFAELLENATVFSDPGAPVVVRTLEHDGEFVVEVVDTGVGMTLNELQEATARVASTAASEILGAQRLGLFVVGRIARRVKARVTITSKEGAGTTATVTMPLSLFDSRMDAPTAHLSANVIEEPLVSDSVDDLIAADAAAAPEATPIDSAALAAGLTASGLPARRRKSQSDSAGPSAEERANIIGLPDRATPDQLSALTADTTAGFTPDEIAPQSAEERASMFRGFRSRRATEMGGTVAVDQEAESLGHASRRGVPDASVDSAQLGDEDPGALAPVEPESVPAIPQFEEDEADFADTAASAPDPQERSAPVSQAGFGHANGAMKDDGRPAFAMPKFDVHERGGMAAHGTSNDNHPEFRADAADNGAAQAADAGFAAPSQEPALDEAPEVWEIPQFEDDAPVADSVQDAPVDDAPMVVPSLEEDEVAPETPSHHWGAAPVDHSAMAEPQFEQVPQHGQDAPFAAPVHEAGVEQVSLDTGPTFAEQLPYESQSPDVASPQAEAAPTVASAPGYTDPSQMTPSELAALTATPSMDELMFGGEKDDKENFFSRLFGRGKKSADAAPSRAPMEPMEPIEPAVEPPAAQFTAPTFAPRAAPEWAPEPAPEAPPRREQSQFASGAFAPEPVSRYKHDGEQNSWDALEVPAPEPAPVEPQATPEPAFPVSARPAPGATNFFAPRNNEPHQPAAFTPDELASPAGWEAAGESALQAAAPDVHTSYTPKVDADGADGNAHPDLSSVFSEFSSLSSRRPKVEKTRAGLQKRRTVDSAPVEVTPIEEEVVMAPRERDADAVRSRFSSFYLGTQRARSDAAEFERRQQTAEPEE